jgi:hypothetical protein
MGLPVAWHHSLTGKGVYRALRNDGRSGGMWRHSRERRVHVTPTSCCAIHITIWILPPHHYPDHWVFSVGGEVKSDNMQCQITECQVFGVLMLLFTDNFVLSPDLFNDWTKNKINYCWQSHLTERNATVLCLLSASCWFLTWLTLQTWRWRQYFLWNISGLIPEGSTLHIPTNITHKDLVCMFPIRQSRVTARKPPYSLQDSL